MRKSLQYLRATLWIIGLFACLPAVSAFAGDTPGAPQQIASLIEQWAQARVTGDVAFLEKFYGKELRLIQMNGGIVERQDDIALFAARQIKPEFIRDTDMTINIYGDTAIVGCVETLKGTYRGTPGEMSLRMLNVLVRRDGRWQLVASQSTPQRKK